MNNIDDLYIAEQGRKLSQFIAEQIDRGIREALGADTASLIENQAARIRELESAAAYDAEAAAAKPPTTRPTPLTTPPPKEPTSD